MPHSSPDFEQGVTEAFAPLRRVLDLWLQGASRWGFWKLKSFDVFLGVPCGVRGINRFTGHKAITMMGAICDVNLEKEAF